MVTLLRRSASGRLTRQRKPQQLLGRNWRDESTRRLADALKRSRAPVGWLSCGTVCT